MKMNVTVKDYQNLSIEDKLCLHVPENHDNPLSGITHVTNDSLTFSFRKGIAMDRAIKLAKERHKQQMDDYTNSLKKI